MLFQASGIWGVSEPMTGPELLDWAVYHNMQYTEEPKLFSDFTVQRMDLEELTESQLETFRKCRWKPSQMDNTTPVVAEQWGKTLKVLDEQQ